MRVEVQAEALVDGGDDFARVPPCPRIESVYFARMAAAEMIEEIRRLPAAESARLLDWLFSDEGELNQLLAAFDRLPRAARLAEEEILALPRAYPAGH